MEEVQSKTIENINLDGLSQQDNLSMKRFLDLDPSQYEKCNLTTNQTTP